MLGDLVELATTVVNPDYTPDIQPHITGTSRANMATSRRRKSQSVSSNAEVNGMPPPATPASAIAPKAGRKPRARSTTSPPGSPKPIIIAPGKGANTAETRSLGKYAATIALSVVIESILQSVCSTFLGTGELATISKVPDTWAMISSLLAYKIGLLSFYWLSGFDAFDVFSLTLLIQTPTALLLWLFYAIRPSTLLFTTLTMIISHAAPYLAFRPVSPTHTRSSTRTSTLRMRNRSILTDPFTTLATSLLATTIFAVLLELSFATFLPKFLIAEFTGLRTLESAHAGPTGLPTLLIALLPAGWACMEFLFAPSTAATLSISTAPIIEIPFDTSRSSFVQHMYWNLWGWYSVRQKELVWRATVLGTLVVLETVVFQLGVLEGVTVKGALGYAGVWGAGVAVLAGVLDWVGGPSD